ncbi:hypothetical protein PMKS-003044 [Pichia membranifaciens]|uniref:Uncharacterized protein n=1 Tax=Pichia membranifaciens TaxID=4926 RepID=A0A1Q2YJJ4_9ASCO|nr:hypothetical protein PMKS-003044 [Pichia membranifaciens]
MLQKSKTYASTFESRDNPSSVMVGTSEKGLMGLLVKHGDDIRVAHSLRRSNFTGDGKKKKDFNVLSNAMLNEIIDASELGGRGSEENSGSVGTSNGVLAVEETSFSLFQGFSAVLPEVDETIQNIKNMSGKMVGGVSGNNESNIKNSLKNNKLASSRSKKIEEITMEKIKTCQNQRVLLNFKSDINYHLDLLEIRKGLGKSEIAEIDAKIDRLYNLRKEIYDNVNYYEKSEINLENKLLEIQDRLEFIKDIEVLNGDGVDGESNGDSTPDDENSGADEYTNDTNNDVNDPNKSSSKIIFKPKNNKQKGKGKSKDKGNDSSILNSGKSSADSRGDDYDDDYVTVYMEEDSRSYSRVTSSTRNLKSGDQIHKFQAHNEAINCLAFDEPFEKLVTCSMDNTVRVWDMNRYKCVGLLEGHNAYVDCVTLSDNLAFTGSIDASVKMWDLDYFNKSHDTYSEGERLTPLLNSFEGHVDAITALTYNNGELVTGSEDKTIRQWDLSTGHILQTIDVMWASSMANSTINFGNSSSSSGSLGASSSNIVVNRDTQYPYLSCMQVFDAALASGGSDGIVRLWDLRSGEVIRQLFGHTGAVTTLQFDKTFSLITGSADRSLRIWDLRTGGILDSFSYDNPIKKIMFDDLKVASVVENERGIHVYDRTEQRHWMLGGDVLSSSTETIDADPTPTPAPAACEGFVNDLQFSGNYLVEGRSDGVVGVWNV